MKSRVITAVALVLGAIALSAQKPVERPETILVNGKILSADSKFTIYEALAIKGDRITAAGTSKEMRALADAKTRIIDLGLRTVIPGMTDSHMHAIRAGLTFATEVHWIGVPTIESAIGRLRDAAKRVPPGAWLIVAGGWTERQFVENAGPRRRSFWRPFPTIPSTSSSAISGR
jgi:predicted amidohydrolase YtcJ